jgi:signal transduction histidine kinase
LAKAEAVHEETTNILTHTSIVLQSFQQQNLTWSKLLFRANNPQLYNALLSGFYAAQRLTMHHAHALQTLLNDDVLQQQITSFVDQLYRLRAHYREALNIYHHSPDSYVDTDHYLAPFVDAIEADLHQITQAIRTRGAHTMDALQIEIEQQRRWAFGLAGVGIVGTVLLVLWFFDRHIGKPLARAIHTAQQISLGHVHSRIPPAATPEFAIFVTAFNHMIDTLAEANAALDRKVHELECEVQQRQRAESVLREAQRKLEASNNDLEAYSYSIAHDLRAPLRAIAGFSQIVLEEASEQLRRDHIRLLRRVGSAVQHMSDLVNGILSLSRVSRQQLQVSRVNLSYLAAEIMQDLRDAQPHRAVDVVIQPDMEVYGDAILLKQMLTNLLENAWKFTEKRADARIAFTMSTRDGVEVYCISDNGVGFDPRYHDKLFGIFQRLHTDQEFEGTGIGLASVQRIVEKHGGTVWAEGQPNQGAAFYFSFERRRHMSQVASIQWPSGGG